MALLLFLLATFKASFNTQNLPNRELHNFCQGGAKSPVETALREACWDLASGCSYYLLWFISFKTKSRDLTLPTGRWRRRWPASPSPQTTSQPGLPLVLSAGGSGSIRGGSRSNRDGGGSLTGGSGRSSSLKRWSRSSLSHHLLHSLATSTDTPWRNWWE